MSAGISRWVNGIAKLPHGPSQYPKVDMRERGLAESALPA